MQIAQLEETLPTVYNSVFKAPILIADAVAGTIMTDTGGTFCWIAINKWKMGTNALNCIRLFELWTSTYLWRLFTIANYLGKCKKSSTKQREGLKILPKTFVSRLKVPHFPLQLHSYVVLTGRSSQGLAWNLHNRHEIRESCNKIVGI